MLECKAEDEMWLERQIDIEILERYIRHNAQGSKISTIQEAVRGSIFTIEERDEDEGSESDEPPPMLPTESDNQALITENGVFDLEEKSLRDSSFGGENLLSSL